jgi:hypothetical protein
MSPTPSGLSPSPRSARRSPEPPRPSLCRLSEAVSYGAAAQRRSYRLRPPARPFVEGSWSMSVRAGSAKLSVAARSTTRHAIVTLFIRRRACTNPAIGAGPARDILSRLSRGAAARRVPIHPRPIGAGSGSSEPAAASGRAAPTAFTRPGGEAIFESSHGKQNADRLLPPGGDPSRRNPRP